LLPDHHEDFIVDSSLAARLRHVYWVGGASGSGKTTIASRLAAQHGLRLYSTDEAMSDHAGRSSPADATYLTRFVAMDMDERWVMRSPETMLDTFHWFRGEGFELIVEDLLRLPTEPGVVVEGFRLLPRLVKPLLAVPNHAVWLLPTTTFRAAVFDGRGSSSWSFLARTSDPERALRNLLERDQMFTARLRIEAKQVGVDAIEVDTTLTEDALADAVTKRFGL
jgi:hypothetical protein